MIHKRYVFFIVAVLVAGTTVTAASEESWQKIAPVGATFTISMPTRALDSMRLIQWNDEQRDMVHVNLYESLTPGRRYLAGEFFKTPAGRFAGLNSFESFVAGIEYSFRTRRGEVIASLSFDREFALSDGKAKQYRVQEWEYKGVLRLVGTDNAFYALMVLGADENDADAQRFLSSFATGPVNTSPESSGVIVDTPANEDTLEQARKTLPPEPWRFPGRPIQGGILNGKAVSLPVPEYPAAAHASGDSGQVSVDVIIDEQGNVIWARASEGPETLRSAAETSAWKARFSPTKLNSQPIKISGRIVYNFASSSQ